MRTLRKDFVFAGIFLNILIFFLLSLFFFIYQVSFLKTDISSFYKSMRGFFFLELVFFFVSSIFTYFFVDSFLRKRLIEPLFEIATFMKRYGKGTKRDVIPEIEVYELEYLLETLREMVEHFEEREKRIETQRKEFEELAERRMQELIEKTERLKKEMEEKKKIQTELFHIQKLESIGKLAGGIAHDFNNLLTAILGCISLLEMDVKDQKAHEYLRRMKSAVERGVELTKALLAFSRKQVLSLKTRDISDFIRDSEKILKRLIGEDIEILLELSQEHLYVSIDETQFLNVLINLATNSRDAMPKGGVIKIKTKRETLKSKVWMGEFYINEGDYAVIYFSDSGVGMDEKTRMRIFEPFFTTKDVGKGTGLGLSTTYGIVKQHGGYILCESEPSKGTTFIIYLPLANIEKEEEIDYKEKKEFYL